MAQVKRVEDLRPYLGQGGCSCKMASGQLDSILKAVGGESEASKASKDPNAVKATNIPKASVAPKTPRASKNDAFPFASVLVDYRTADDGGVIAIDDRRALVQTVDFFASPVADPYLFGQISATNGISDVYAMGGRPLSALNLLALPDEAAHLAPQILAGAQAVFDAHGIALLGGHSINNAVPLYGAAVTGLVDRAAIWTNGGAQAGDKLVLTKALGTGILMLAHRASLCESAVRAAIDSMVRSNAQAYERALQYDIHGATDITGFGFLGHCLEMAAPNGCSLHIYGQSVPFLPEAVELASMGFLPKATYSNGRHCEGQIEWRGGLSQAEKDVMLDPQTSGGLLLALSAEEAEAYVAAAQANGEQAWIVGEVRERGERALVVE